MQERLRKQMNLKHRSHYRECLEIADVKEMIHVIKCAEIKENGRKIKFHVNMYVIEFLHKILPQRFSSL